GGEAAACLPGTVCVLALPFHADGDTTGSESLLYDAYACAPGVDESGPEIVYDVLVPAAGTLAATVTDGPTVDVDPHILASLKDGICLARDDVTASAAVEPGHVYVVVDTYVTGGVAAVGPYTLDLTLAP
ncbi:MAG: hypothetical protein HY908_24205, partial [Myxococcales bacterium]|nr:hypothetical protein [Myxococcales bacterium]